MSGLLDAITVLLDAIAKDEARHGGLLSRSTLRQADELRVLVTRERRARGEPQPAEPAVPRQPGGPL